MGHYNKLIYKDEIDPKLLARGYSEDQLKQMMESRKGSGPSEVISCNLHLTGRLDRWKYFHFNYVMTLFNSYDKSGVMPFPGTLSEQPAKIIEIFDLLEQLKHEHNEMIRREQAREQAKAKRKNASGRR